MNEENGLMETEIQAEAPEVPEITLDALKDGKISFKELPKPEKARLAAEAREQLPDDDAREAWDMGWRSKEFFGGKKLDGSTKEFVDYKDFLRKINEVAPVKNERIRSLSKENEDLRKAMDEQKAELRKLMEIQKMSHERDLFSEEEKIAQEIRDAEEFGDVGKYKAAEARRQILEQNKLKLKSFEPETPKYEAPPVQQISPEVAEWTAKNPWFYSNPELQKFCIAQDNILMGSRPDLSISERLDLVARSAEISFPGMIPSSPTKPAVLSSRTSGAFSKARESAVTFDSLSPSEKQQAEYAIKQGVFKDKADVMKTYNLMKK